MGRLRTWSSALVAASVLAACGGPEPGSQEELRARLDSIGLPASMVELDHHYNASCPTGCPSIVVWYEVIGPPEQVRAELISAVTAAGWDLNDSTASVGVYNARSENHMLFLVVDPARIADNPYAPPGAKVEMVMGTLADPGE